ncbi:MAG: methyltransferase domain-containing protein, partial [Candidatus Thermoplasmatota archaeon]
MNRLDLHVREKVLDLATGPGEPAMSIARLVGLDGEVVGVDLSEKMVELATNLSRERRLSNVVFKVMDAEKLEFPDETFDVAVSRFGFQIFTNPEAVAKEAHRVLKPKGRIGVSVWSTAEKSQAIHVLVGPMLEFAEPDESGYLPTPYELGGPGEMVKFLGAAGFQDAEEERRSHMFVAP